jgi:hypothetical protein
MEGAGRMTATARADTGAHRARREAWVRGCVQVCDDGALAATISIGSLPLNRALGIRPAQTGGRHGEEVKETMRSITGFAP